ncbi:DUF2306 domain-containing protein [Roseibium sp.]|uniref:DUF2306 domain-containing protein n=1 Tax=Roseibium sp. TaxID=1936156 RepID=UPI003BB019CF
MTLSPLLDAGWLVASHAGAALVALITGVFQLRAPKGTRSHRTLGYLWFALMVWVSGSSLFIYTIRLWGPFSPIHILSLLTLVFLAGGILTAQRGQIRAHRSIMVLTFTGALVIAGLFTLLPGRIMHEVIFGG